MIKFVPFLLITLFIYGCTFPSEQPKIVQKKVHTTKKAEAPFEPKEDFYKIKSPIQCVPYTREISGFQIWGNAHTWWDQVRTGKHKDNFTTGHKPKVGAVYVLSDTKRNKYGHVSVVKRIIDRRTIEVAHTNWGGNRETRRVVYKSMPVVDVSDNNDWSKARFWNYPSKSYGRVYPADGFIYRK